MIRISKKCSNKPCTIEHKTDGEWVDFAYNDSEMSIVAVFSCEHDAFIYILEAISHFITLAALGEVDEDDIPRLRDFRMVFADTIIEPPAHDDCIGNVDDASQFLQRFRRVT